MKKIKVLVLVFLVVTLFLTGCSTGPYPYEYKPEIKTWGWSESLTEDGWKVALGGDVDWVFGIWDPSHKALQLCPPAKVRYHLNVEEGDYFSSLLYLCWINKEGDELLVTIEDGKGKQDYSFNITKVDIGQVVAPDALSQDSPDTFYCSPHPIRPVEKEVTVTLEAREGCPNLAQVGLFQQMQMSEPELWGGKRFGKLVSFLVPLEMQKAARADSLFFWGLLACGVFFCLVLSRFATKTFRILIGSAIYFTLAWVALMMRGKPESYTLGSLLAANLFLVVALIGFLAARRR